MNDEGVRFIHERCGPLNVNSMDDAATLITKELRRQRERNTSDADLGRHLAWVIGFDTLIEQRNQIRQFTSLIVKEQPK